MRKKTEKKNTPNPTSFFFCQAIVAGVPKSPYNGSTDTPSNTVRYRKGTTRTTTTRRPGSSNWPYKRMCIVVDQHWRWSSSWECVLLLLLVGWILLLLLLLVGCSLLVAVIMLLVSKSVVRLFLFFVWPVVLVFCFIFFVFLEECYNRPWVVFFSVFTRVVDHYIARERGTDTGTIIINQYSHSFQCGLLLLGILFFISSSSLPYSLPQPLLPSSNALKSLFLEGVLCIGSAGIMLLYG